jgi:hypothetical protein
MLGEAEGDDAADEPADDAADVAGLLPEAAGPPDPQPAVSSRTASTASQGIDPDLDTVPHPARGPAALNSTAR